MIPVGPQMLSRHLLLLGGIGTGKSNAFNFLISNILYMKTQKDVVIIFDTNKISITIYIFFIIFKFFNYFNIII